MKIMGENYGTQFIVDSMIKHIMIRDIVVSLRFRQIIFLNAYLHSPEDQIVSSFFCHR